MTTSQYVFINRSVSIQTSNDSFYINLGEEINRIPNKVIELTSIVLESIVEYPFLLIRADVQPTNSFTNDGYGPCLSIMRNNSKNGAHWNYTECGFEQPKFVLSNTNNFNVAFYAGATQAGINDPTLIQLTQAQILNFSIIFKISYPENGAISKHYTNELPLPSLRPYL